jgi:hypothetical protein
MPHSPQLIFGTKGLIGLHKKLHSVWAMPLLFLMTLHGCHRSPRLIAPLLQGHMKDIDTALTVITTASIGITHHDIATLTAGLLLIATLALLVVDIRLLSAVDLTGPRATEEGGVAITAVVIAVVVVAADDVMLAAGHDLTRKLRPVVLLLHLLLPLRMRLLPQL